MKSPDKSAAVEAVLKSISVMEEELRRVEAQADLLRRAISSSRETAIALNGGPLPQSGTSVSPAQQARKQTPPTKYPRPIGDAAAELIKAVGHPLSLQDIKARLAEQGITPSTETLSSVLSKDHRKRFKSVVRGVYTLKTLVEMKKQEGEAENQDEDHLVLTG